MLSFSHFMLLIFTHCLSPSTSGMLTHDSTSSIPCYSFSHIAFHPPLPVNARFRCVELSAKHGTVRKVRTLVVFVCWLAPKYILLLLTRFRETHSMAIVTTLITRSGHKNVSIKNRKWFFHLDRSFSLLLLKNNFENTLVLESLAAWRNLAATRIFLSPSLM